MVLINLKCTLNCKLSSIGKCRLSSILNKTKNTIKTKKKIFDSQVTPVKLRHYLRLKISMLFFCCLILYVYIRTFFLQYTVSLPETEFRCLPGFEVVYNDNVF